MAVCPTCDYPSIATIADSHLLGVPSNSANLNPQTLTRGRSRLAPTGAPLRVMLTGSGDTSDTLTVTGQKQGGEQREHQMLTYHIAVGTFSKIGVDRSTTKLAQVFLKGLSHQQLGCLTITAHVC